MRYFEDPILGKGRAADVSGGTGSADYVGGTRIAIAGETISFVNSATIQNVTGNSVTLEPDMAYKITATASAVTLNANVPAAGSWAYEGHAEIFVAGTGYIVTGANVVLANPLEPDAVNNCVLRFHDGTCIIDVEDHVYGYIVTSISGTTQGTLPYGITSASQEYIAFDATTNGSTIDLSGSTASAEKHLVGNGYTSTTLTGAVDCSTNKVTVANLALSDVQVTGGVMTLGDAYIPSGSTVAVSGGGLAVEKVSGNGGVIDFGNTPTSIHLNGAHVSNVQITGGTERYGTGLGLFNVNSGIADFTNVSFYDNVCGTGVLYVRATAIVNVSGCTFYNYDSTSGTGAHTDIKVGSGTLNVRDCKFDRKGNIWGNAVFGQVNLNGINRLPDATITLDGKVTLTSGAILDITGNTNAAPINPGGGIVFEAGGATVLVGSGTASSSYMMDNVTLPAGAKLTNTATVDLNSAGRIVAPDNQTTVASGVTLTGGTSFVGGVFYVDKGALNCSGCTFTKNVGTSAGCVLDTNGSNGISTLVNCDITSNGNTPIYAQYGKIVMSGCSVTDNGTNPIACYGAHGSIELYDCYVSNGQTQIYGVRATEGKLVVSNSTILDSLHINGTGEIVLAGENTIRDVFTNTPSVTRTVTISSGAIINLTSSIAPGGTGGITVLTGGCTVNGNVIPAGTYTSIDSNGQPT